MRSEVYMYFVTAEDDMYHIEKLRSDFGEINAALETIHKDPGAHLPLGQLKQQLLYHKIYLICLFCRKKNSGTDINGSKDSPFEWF